MSLEEAAQAIQEAHHLLITAGAGMGVDSGLPDFRGREGFWEAYPPYKELGFSFVEMANPDTFHVDPALAWGFYGHRLALYRKTQPHEGFHMLRRWAKKKESTFVLTSNVDGHFQKAGFDPERVFEVHGSIHHLQCLRPCSRRVWPADDIEVTVDMETMRAGATLPVCYDCGALARPNILLFGDISYITTRQQEQGQRFQAWLWQVGEDLLVVLEMGAGVVVPTIRFKGEQLAQAPNVRLIRINPRDAGAPHGEISLQMGALEALRLLDAAVHL